MFIDTLSLFRNCGVESSTDDWFVGSLATLVGTTDNHCQPANTTR